MKHTQQVQEVLVRGTSSKPIQPTETTFEPRGAESQRLLCSLFMTGELGLLPIRVAWETLVFRAGRI